MSNASVERPVSLRHFAVGLTPAAIAVVFLALHLPFLPASLEDLDSINFALGVRHFDVAQHQPHPPGYPVFIAARQGWCTRVVPTKPRALSARQRRRRRAGRVRAGRAVRAARRQSAAGDWSVAAAALVTVTSPLYWFTAARPLSDMPGLAAALGGAGADAVGDDDRAASSRRRSSRRWRSAFGRRSRG